MSESADQLNKALQRLETSTKEILATRGYNHDAKALKMLIELIKEQLTNELPNTRPTTRTLR
jgi:hypothetical protein